MRRKKEKKVFAVDMHIGILKDYSRWKHIFDNGCTDPSYCDGVNINLVRNHILYDKKKVEEKLKDNFIAYPDSYFYPDPVELSNDFMAVDRRLAVLGKVLTANKDICYNEAIRFEWGEVL